MTKEDILIFGSSRGVHHYDPQIIEDSLSMTCYNCAYDGCGIITAYGLLSTLLEHYTPRVIIYDVMPTFDYYTENGSKNKYLGPLKMLYGRTDQLDSIFATISPTEKWKMKSGMYRINSKFIQMLTENISYRNESVKGYLPVDRQMFEEPEVFETASYMVEYDEIKQHYLNEFIRLCKMHNIKLVFYASPSYKKTIDSNFDYINKIAQEEGIEFVNHYCDSDFVYNNSYFYDSVHMNLTGATDYTKVVVEELNTILECD